MSNLPIVPPALPAWEGLHPLVVHFPVALLLAAPVCVLFGLLPRVGQGFRIAALILFVMGTIGAFVAVESGEASAQVVTLTPEARETLEQHEELAESVGWLFALLTAAYAAILLLPAFVSRVLKKRLPRGVPVACSILFLVATGLCAGVLANTAHLGGQLVYVHRVENWVLR